MLELLSGYREGHFFGRRKTHRGQRLYHLPGKFRSVIAQQRTRCSSPEAQFLRHPQDIPRSQPLTNVDCQRFAREGIDDSQRTKSLTACQLVRNEVPIARVICRCGPPRGRGDSFVPVVCDSACSVATRLLPVATARESCGSHIAHRSPRFRTCAGAVPSAGRDDFDIDTPSATTSPGGKSGAPQLRTLTSDSPRSCASGAASPFLWGVGRHRLVQRQLGDQLLQLGVLVL